VPDHHINTELFGRNVPGMTAALQASVVGIAGCGGVGSNVAVSLTRSGIGRLILADDDRVEVSNLNRQHFFQSDLGQIKVEALAGHLRAIHPSVQITTHRQRLRPDDIGHLFGDADLLIEAFDRAQEKQWLIESWAAAYPERPIICASGLAGWGRTRALAVRSAGRIYVCGDGESDMSQGLCAARVAIVANMQANVAIELLMRAKVDPPDVARAGDDLPC
jgi:sulfur carrier protein ThiS adenylyltransferase